MRSKAARSDVLFEEIKPMLAGYPPEVQGAALGQLLALWAAGFVSDDPATEQEARAAMLEHTFDLIRAMVPLMYETHVREMRGSR